MHVFNARLDCARLLRNAFDIVSKASERADESRMPDVSAKLLDLEVDLLQLHAEVLQLAAESGRPPAMEDPGHPVGEDVPF